MTRTIKTRGKARQRRKVQVIDMALIDWKTRHEDAMRYPFEVETPHVLMHRSVTAMLKLWGTDDYFVQPNLVDIIQAARQLLNMESGRLDCGTLDGFYCEALRKLGVVV